MGVGPVGQDPILRRAPVHRINTLKNNNSNNFAKVKLTYSKMDPFEVDS